MEIQMVDTEKLIPYARNPRKNTLAVDKVAASIKEFGFKQPIVVDKDMVIVVGHTRYIAAQKLEIETVPVIIAKDLTPQQAKAYRITDNKTHELTEWDFELLTLELQELSDSDYDLVNTAFAQSEIDFIINTHIGEKVEDYSDEWVEMPSNNNDDLLTSFKDIIVHFKNQEAVNEFMKLIKQKITDKTKYINFPYEERKDHTIQEFVDGTK